MNGLNELVDWMRARGVVRLKTVAAGDPVELLLDPNWREVKSPATGESGEGEPPVTRPADAPPGEFDPDLLYAATPTSFDRGGRG